MCKIHWVLLFIACTALWAKETNTISPPKAKKEIVTIHKHGHTRTDPYRWLNQRDNPAVLEYLKAENMYTQMMMEKSKDLQKSLYEEIKNRIEEDQSTPPHQEGNYLYYTRYEKNKSHPIYCRKKNSQNSIEEIILDVNALAKGHAYYEIENIKISPNENLIAFTEDTQGRRKFKIRIKDLSTGKFLSDELINATPSFEWANDSQTLFYTTADPVSLRSYRVYKHKLNTPSADDKLVYEEKDNAFSAEISKTKSREYLLIGSFKKNTTEFQYLDANHPDKTFRVFSPRKSGREYYVEHHQNKFIILTNENAINFKVMQTDVNKTAFKNWKPLIPHRPDIYLANIHVFNNFLVLEEQKKGLTQIKIHPFNNNSPFYIDFDETDYAVSIDKNPEYSSDLLRFNFSSLKTPKSVYDFDTQTKQKILRKQDKMLGGFDSNHYEAKRIYAKAKDGTEIPISIVYRKDKFIPHKNPLLLAGYGAYGVNYDPSFNAYVVSLLDRGFVYAIAHVRGGSELGLDWYFQGKLLKKKNSFYDFIACAKYLDKMGYADPAKLYAIGASGGGLLVGAVMNMEPTLFKGIIAYVPFVDLMNTMEDPSIPLTTGEYAEWGNPKDKKYYEYMLSYSPYDNIRKTAYPNLLVITSYQDSQVQYWEPVKWVAKLRDLKTNDNLLLLQILMNASHSGGSGRYEAYQHKAFEFAFILGLEGYH